MTHLDPAHGAIVNIVRRSLNVQDRPTHHQEAWLEAESPELLAYLEMLSARGELAGWRTLRDRVQFRVEILSESKMQPCSRPWLAAIWHTLPELVALGDRILGDLAEKNGPASDIVLVASDTAAGAGGDGDKGGSEKAGSATTNRPRPSSRLNLPVVQVTLTLAEEKALDLGKDPEDMDTDNDVTPDGPQGTDGLTGPRRPGGRK